MAAAISPLAPARFPDMPPVAGVKFATAAAGIRYGGRTDVLLALFEQGTTVAGVFTRSKCPSAPVDWCRAHLKGGEARALVVNSGNANAFTGKSGRAATKLIADIAARAAGCKPSDVFLASTGVIGEPLDATKFGAVMDQLVADAVPGAWQAAAKAIMTTDTFPKGAAAITRLGGAPITVCGIAKGAGMIAPDMATLLSFVFTDAPISPRVLQSLLQQGVADSFNAVTIDGEDANWGRVVMAVGKAGERADRDRLSIWFGGIRVAHRGERDPSYDEAAVSATMKKPEITLKVALGLGRGRDRVLTCDLTKEYMAINGDYRS